MESKATNDKAPLGYQMDVAVLDDYLHSLLLTNFFTSLDPLLQNQSEPTTTNLPRTLQIVLASLLPAATLWITQTQTPATKALGLRTVMTNVNSSPHTTKYKYIFFAAILPLFYHGLQRLVWKLQQECMEDDNNNETNPPEDVHDNDNDNEISIQTRRIAKQRQYTIANAIVQLVELGLPLCKLGLLLSLLWKNPKQTPQSPRLAMVLAGLGFLRANRDSHSNHNPGTLDSVAHPNGTPPPPPSPRLYVLYAHRRWLYEESLQTLKIVFTPLLASLQEGRQFVEACIERLVRAVTSRLVSSNIMTTASSRAVSSADAPCSLCGKDPVAIPYETDACDHVFCYTCLWKASYRRRGTIATSPNNHTSSFNGTGFPCPSCHRIIRSSRPIRPVHPY